MHHPLRRALRKAGRSSLGIAILGERPVEARLCGWLLRDRMRLPTLPAQELFPGLPEGQIAGDTELLKLLVEHLRPARILSTDDGAEQSGDSFELVLVSAVGSYRAVREASDAALGRVIESGHVIWRGYENRGYFSPGREVPECLVDLAHALPIVHIAGSALAVHSPAWASASYYASGKTGA